MVLRVGKVGIVGREVVAWTVTSQTVCGKTETKGGLQLSIYRSRVSEMDCYLM